MEVVKICYTCSQVKPIEEFHKRKDSKDGHWRQCKICANIQSQKYRKACRKAVLEYRRKYYDSHKEQIRLKNIAYRERRYQNLLKRTYGLNVEDYQKLVTKQSGLCAICQLYTKLVVDHDHSTGAIRGLLCGKCNKGIGLFKDNSSYLKNAAKYLEEKCHEEKQKIKEKTFK